MADSRFPRIRSVLAGILLFLLAGIGWFLWRIQIPVPAVTGMAAAPLLTDARYQRVQAGPDHYRIGNNWLRKNAFGIWEMYIEGSPYERGLVYGVLAKELMHQQEVVFVDQLKEIIPGTLLLHTLKYFIGWFNRDIDQYIPLENQQEIYGISQSFSDDFGFIGKKYYRILNYHAAHDIGHALVDMNMVGCTSFAVSNDFSADSSLLIGRNFDFNMGDHFAENKVMLFVKPDDGYPFASVSWAGFTGVVSGMNQRGLTVTLNAARSDIPYTAKTPVSILAREILQYAATIEEAVAIARKRETFVSESLLIGSANDGKALIIEKTPTKMDVYDPGIPALVCANHYQSPLLQNDPANLENIRSSDSRYRFDRLQQLLIQQKPVSTQQGAALLRDVRGIDDKFIGYGNPKSLNQLLAHHGVLFKPDSLLMWVSANPYQLGAFVAYNLHETFEASEFIPDTTRTIPADPFLQTDDFRKFEQFKITRSAIQRYLMTGNELHLPARQLREFIADNPESYQPYAYLGDYFRQKKDYLKAVVYYEQALTKEPSSPKEAATIRDKLAECRKAM